MLSTLDLKLKEMKILPLFWRWKVLNLRRQIFGELFKIDNMERRTWTTGGGEMLGMLHFDIPEKVVTSRNENDFAPQDAKT